MTLVQTVRYYAEEARKTLDVAKGLLDRGAYRAALHEAYYAMFYAATAALGTHERYYKRHAAVIAEFNRLFVHELRLFPSPLGADFARALDARLKFDYEPQAATEGDAAREIAAAERFLAAVAPYVESWLATAQDKDA